MTRGEPLTPRRKLLLQAALLIAAGFAIFYPCLHGGWIWDDTMLISENPDLRDTGGLFRIWFGAPSTDYWPVTWTLLWIEWHLWGADTLGYHLTSLVLHLTSAFLVWRLLDRLGLRWSWLGALIFTVHPLAVESVAWMCEIKNTLSLPFFLLALLAYIEADRTGKREGYDWALLLYLVAMLCKSSVVMLPFVLLLYLWWRHGRVTGADLRRMVPYLVIAVALGCVTLYFQASHYGESAVVKNRTLFERLVGASADIFFYLGKFVVPTDLLPIYPRWNLDPPSLARILTLPVLALTVAALGIVRRKGWGRHAVLGAGFFLINLLPVLGLTRMTWMNISWVADHLVYLPMIGLIGCTAALAETMYRRLGTLVRPWFLAMIAGVLLALTLKSHRYAAMFIDLKTLTTLTVNFQWD